MNEQQLRFRCTALFALTCSPGFTSKKWIHHVPGDKVCQACDRCETLCIPHLEYMELPDLL